MLGKQIASSVACAAVAATLCACNNIAPTSNPTATRTTQISPVATESPDSGSDLACTGVQVEINSIQQAQQGTLTGDSWVLEQRLASAVESAPDEIKLAASQVATAIEGVLRHPDQFEGKAADPVVVRDLDVLQQWHAQHC